MHLSTDPSPHDYHHGNTPIHSPQLAVHYCSIALTLLPRVAMAIKIIAVAEGFDVRTAHSTNIAGVNLSIKAQGQTLWRSPGRKAS